MLRKRLAVLHAIFVLSAMVVLLVVLGFILPDFCNTIFKRYIKNA